MKRFGSLVLLCMVMLASAVYACPVEKGDHKGRHPHVKKMAFYKTHLDLNETQLKQLDSINERYKVKHETIAASITPLKSRIHELKMADEPDYKEIRRTLEELAPLHQDMQMNFIHQHGEIKAILTKKQQAKLKKLKKNKHKKRGKKHGHGHR